MLPFLPTSDPILRMQERARLDALLEGRAVVFLYVVADPGIDLRRHWYAIHRMTAVQPACRLVRARGDLHRKRLIAFHAPQHEQAWIGCGHVHVVTLGFIAMQLELEARMQPVADAVMLDEQHFCAARMPRNHAMRLPDHIGPLALCRPALHHHSEGKLRLFHSPALYRVCYDFP